jgi:hypothetical protein
VAGKRLSGGRTRRAGLFSSGCIGLSSMLALAGAPADGVPAARSTTPTACGGLVVDAMFAAEAEHLGRGHACEHLQLRVHPAAPARRVKGVVAATARPTSVVGRWSAARNPGTATVGIAAVLLHTGRVLLVGAEDNAGESTPAYLFNPVTGRGHAVTPPAPIFCSSLTPLSDGRILSVGERSPSPTGSTTSCCSILAASSGCPNQPLRRLATTRRQPGSPTAAWSSRPVGRRTE